MFRHPQGHARVGGDRQRTRHGKEPGPQPPGLPPAPEGPEDRAREDRRNEKGGGIPRCASRRKRRHRPDPLPGKRPHRHKDPGRHLSQPGGAGASHPPQGGEGADEDRAHGDGGQRERQQPQRRGRRGIPEQAGRRRVGGQQQKRAGKDAAGGGIEDRPAQDASRAAGPPRPHLLRHQPHRGKPRPRDRHRGGKAVHGEHQMEQAQCLCSHPARQIRSEDQSRRLQQHGHRRQKQRALYERARLHRIPSPDRTSSVSRILCGRTAG